MEENDEKSVEKINGFIILELIKENITVLDLSNKNINVIDDNMQLPVNLTELYLKHNELNEVPITLLNLEKLRILDISYNKIKYFDDIPNFYNTIEQLNISNNNLFGPPYWVWAENCKNLAYINLSFNIHITNSFVNGYFEELLEYKTLVTNIVINNCKLTKHLKLLSTFPKAKKLSIGTSDMSLSSSINMLEEVPFKGLDKCCDLEILELSNTNLYNITSNIIIYINLKEINLSLNKLSSIPEEFCCLVNLEICILSFNNLLYLPESFNKLEKLNSLLLNSNCLCMLPENLCRLPHLSKLDLYDNQLYEAPEMEKLLEVDLAQNYFDEPQNEEYIIKKEKIRSNNTERYDGRKLEMIKESDCSSIGFDDELFFRSDSDKEELSNRPLSSPEDWDSDDYWVPHFSRPSSMPHSPWLFFVKRRMEQGSFCPMDAHPISIAERVRYEKLCHPRLDYESDGQFDDYSGDDN